MQIETLPRRLGTARPQSVLILSKELTVNGTARVRGQSRAAARMSAIVGGLA